MKVQKCKKCNRVRLFPTKKQPSNWFALTENFAKILIEQNELEETICEKCEQGHPPNTTTNNH